MPDRLANRMSARPLGVRVWINKMIFSEIQYLWDALASLFTSFEKSGLFLFLESKNYLQKDQTISQISKNIRNKFPHIC